MAREMKNSGIEWIGKIPNDWEISRIGEIYNQRIVKVSDKDYMPLSVTMKGIVPQLATAAKTDDGDNRKLVKKGDFVINSRSDRRGSCGISDYDGSVSLINIILSPYKNMNSIYYNWLFHSNMFSSEFYKWGHGIVDDLWTTRWQEMKCISIPRPTLDEQERIALFLDSKCQEIDNVLAKTRSSIEEYKKLKQAIITKAVTKGIRKNRKMKDSGIEWIGEIPEEWEIRTLGNVTLSLRNGYVGPTKDLFVETGIKYIQSLHIKDGNIEFNKHPYYVTETWVSNRPRIHTNDLLIVQTGDIGNVGLVNKEYDNCGCHALIIASINSSIMMPRFLMYYLLSIPGKELLLQKKTGALLPHLNSGKIKSCSICCPMIAEQTAVINYLDDNCSRINTIIQKKEQLISELESYKKSLIYEYVTGKKEVPMA